MTPLNSFRSFQEIPSIKDLMADVCMTAVLSPVTIYQFMLRFVYYCRSYSFLTARLAGVIGSSRLFVDSSPYSPHSERGMDVAAGVLSAAIEEFKDPKIGVSHRTMSYGLLDRLAEYAGLTEIETRQIAQSGTWLDEILQEVDRGYSADPSNLQSMVKALGFHIGAEIVGSCESAVIYSKLFAQQRGTQFDQFMRQHKLVFEGGRISPAYWVAVHGTQHSIGVEAEHAEDAIHALEKIFQYSNGVTESQILSWADEGFSHFNRVQISFFQEVRNELEQYLELQHPVPESFALT